MSKNKKGFKIKPLHSLFKDKGVSCPQNIKILTRFYLVSAPEPERRNASLTARHLLSRHFRNVTRPSLTVEGERVNQVHVRSYRGTF